MKAPRQTAQPEAPPDLESGALADPRRRPEAPGRYIALSYKLTATYHGSRSDAEKSLADMPASERAGIVDAQMGVTLASQSAYPAVQAAVSGEVLGIMRRDGPLGDLASQGGCKLHHQWAAWQLQLEPETFRRIASSGRVALPSCLRG